MSIEHIEPQSSKGMVESDLASIGNLWFLKTAFNNELGNSSATIKLKKYKQHQLPCDSELLRADVWTANEIKRREQVLGEQFWQLIDEGFSLSKRSNIQ